MVAKIGDERVSKNGYMYIKTPQGWISKHRYLCGRRIGRPLQDNERVRFKDGDRTNLDLDNMEVYTAKKQTKRTRAAVLESKIEDMKAELEDIQRNGTRIRTRNKPTG